MRPDDLADDVISVIDGAIGPVLERLAAADVRIAELERRLTASDAQRDFQTAGHVEAIAALQDRLAAVTTTPGPEGPPGPPGPPGEPGPPGAAGLRYVGTYDAGTEYQPGQIVTHHGSAWHCHAMTHARPGESPDWQLMVQRGKAGRNADREGIR